MTRLKKCLRRLARCAFLLSEALLNRGRSRRLLEQCLRCIESSSFPNRPDSPQSTISSVEREIREAGGEPTAILVDTRDFESVQKLVDETVKVYGKLDVLIYNSGAIWWSSIEGTPMKRLQLMQRVNPEGLYGILQAALPHFKNNGQKGRIIVVSPP